MPKEVSSKRLSVLVFSTLFPHKGEPMQGIFVENRLRHLINDVDIDATVIAPVPWFPFRNRIFGKYGRAARADLEETRDGLTIYHPRYIVIPKIGMMLTPFFLARASLNMVRKLLRSGAKFDLIDAHYLYPDCVSAARLAAELDIPFTATARGSDVTQIALMSGPKRMILQTCASAARIITVSKSLKDKLVAIGAEEQNISVLRNGVDSGKFCPSSQDRIKILGPLGLDSNAPIIMFAGWLIERKRVDIVIDAMVHLPKAQAIIVGDGPLHSALRSQTKALNLEARIKFVGQKNPAEMPEYFSVADVLCLPSEREGWANVMLEAMACGASIVARNVDGALELITEGAPGRLVDGDDPAQYAEAIDELLRQKTAREEIRSYALGYSWESTSARQMEIFQKITYRGNRE